MSKGVSPNKGRTKKEKTRGSSKGKGRGRTVSPGVRWLLVLLWAGGIWALSSIPDLQSGLQQDFLLRKVAHGVEFAVLAMLLVWALPKPRQRTWLRYFGALILAVEYAAIDEIHQGFVPGRAPSLRDVGIDAVGVLVGLLIFWLVALVRKRAS